MAQAQLIATRSAAGKFSVDSFPAKNLSTKNTHAILEVLIGKWRLQRIEVNRLLEQLLSGDWLACPAAEQTQTLQVLCAELVDYVSTGHFEIYGRVLPRKLQPDPDLHALLQHIFRGIGWSTDAVLSFNDRFLHTSPATRIRRIRQFLIRFGRALQLRFALEEQLLDLCGH